jgi:uncharacterized protein (DUF2235 family)
MGKNIIICFDGTGNEYGRINTNVVKVFETIKRDENQIAFYDPGVGTFDFLGRTVGKEVGIILGKAFGAGLQQNIEDGYEYLMNRYEPGDKLFLFGFSRGAFTVRALAGMIHYFGILQKGSKNLIPYVSKMYNQKKIEIADGFKQTFSHECKPYFIGVWDTVGSLGYIHGKQFFNTTLNGDIKYGYHAVAIDEKRKKFPVSLWDESKKEKGQVIEQVWFTGVHSDVGGGYAERGLSDIAFAWMMDKAVKCGVRLKEDWQKGLCQNYSGKMHESRKGLWNIWDEVIREIPEGAKIHQSVLDRIEKEKYTLKNLPNKYKKVKNPSYLAKES